MWIDILVPFFLPINTTTPITQLQSNYWERVEESPPTGNFEPMIFRIYITFWLDMVVFVEGYLT